MPFGPTAAYHQKTCELGTIQANGESGQQSNKKSATPYSLHVRILTPICLCSGITLCTLDLDSYKHEGRLVCLETPSLKSTMIFDSNSTLPYALLTTSVILAIAYRYYYRWASRMVDIVPGPSTDSWLYGASPAFISSLLSPFFTHDDVLPLGFSGNLSKLINGETGRHETEWHAKYGKVVRVSGPLGVRICFFISFCVTLINH